MSGDRFWFDLTLWTNDPDVARRADRAGVDRIGLDLESIGKHDRQRNLGTWISPHREDQLPAIRAVLSRASLFVRCNPAGPQSSDEIRRLIDAGVEIIMLPNFRSAREVLEVLRIVDGQAQLVPLIERFEATQCIDELLAIPAVEEFHLGLNDLSFDLKLDNRLALLAAPWIVTLAHRIRSAGRRLGVAGIGRAGDDSLPVPSDLIYASLARLHATGSLVSRSFRVDELQTDDLAREIGSTRARLAYWAAADADSIEQARLALLQAVKEPIQ
ncbi:MAG: hypothetical protein KDG50_04995 [Chromatiales bacterium]|nr:hypothetical protein [Chromatiales bacterium]